MFIGWNRPLSFQKVITIVPINSITTCYARNKLYCRLNELTNAVQAASKTKNGFIIMCYFDKKLFSVLSIAFYTRVLHSIDCFIPSQVIFLTFKDI